MPCRERNKKNKAAGLCITCGVNKAIENKTNCSKCITHKYNENRNLKIETFNAYGGCVCVNCGITDVDVLALDHVNNDGAKHRKELAPKKKGHPAGGANVYRKLRRLNFPDKNRFQVLCSNCNCLKLCNRGKLRKVEWDMKNRNTKVEAISFVEEQQSTTMTANFNN